MSVRSADGASAPRRRDRHYNTYLGENLAEGNAGALATFEQWRTSPHHNENMLYPEFKAIGIARVYSATNEYKWVWATDFGGYVDTVMTESTTPATATSGNLLADGGFETTAVTAGVGYRSVRTVNRWYANASTGGSATPSTAGAASGTRSLLVKDPNPGSVTVTQVVGATAGKTYRLAARAARPVGNSRQSIWVDFLDGSFNDLGRVRAYAGSSNAWSVVATSAVAPQNTRYARVVIYGAATDTYASTYYWDDVSLTAQ